MPRVEVATLERAGPATNDLLGYAVYGPGDGPTTVRTRWTFKDGDWRTFDVCVLLGGTL